MNKTNTKTQTNQNNYRRNIQDSKSINLTNININNKDTIILAVDNK